MTDAPSIRARLARRFDPDELRAIKRLWVRHSIAEDARDIDGLVATLAEDCAYELDPDRPALGRPRRGPGVLHGAVRGVPGQPVRAERDRRRAPGRVRGGATDRHEPGAVGRRPGVGTPGLARGADPVPVGPGRPPVRRRADLVRPGRRALRPGPTGPTRGGHHHDDPRPEARPVPRPVPGRRRDQRPHADAGPRARGPRLGRDDVLGRPAATRRQPAGRDDGVTLARPGGLRAGRRAPRLRAVPGPHPATRRPRPGCCSPRSRCGG